MKPSGQHHKTTNNTSTRGRSSPRVCSSKSKLSTTRTAIQKRKIAVKSSTVISGQPVRCPTQALLPRIPDVGSPIQKNAPVVLGTLAKECPQYPEKFKLQLFPIDETTRKELEKDKYNPFLELTLGSRKRISSVVKHLKFKWGNSKAATGELLLFPYNACLENLPDHRMWTCKDSSTSAADVYAAIGSPTIFRLRYGWFSDHKPETCESALMPSGDDLQTNKNQEARTTDEEMHHFSVSNREHAPFSTCDSFNEIFGAPVERDILVQPMDNLKGNNYSALLWADSAISMGALLVEAEPTPDVNCSHPLPVLSNSNLQQIPVSCDSFDAAIASHIARYEAAYTSTQVQSSSILEAEETCHPFPVQNISSSKDAFLNKDSLFASDDGNAGSSSLKFQNMLSSQILRTHIDACQEPASDLQASTRSDDHMKLIPALQPETVGEAAEELKADLKQHIEGSDNGAIDPGSMGICWPESLGPWVYGASSSRLMPGGECSISLSALIARSLDAFQNCSFFSSEQKVQST